MGFSTRSLLSAALMLGQASAALQPIEMKGTKFFYKNGTQFYMKGIAYQQAVGAAGAKQSTDSFVDPLADSASCKRDVPIMKAAGTNTIRVYQIKPTEDHTECMKLLDDAGIYVIADLSEPSTSIQQNGSQWNIPLFTRYKSVVDEMAKFDNVIGFFSGNEVTNSKDNTPASAYVKAATRDTKAYIAKTVNRWMGVGYATNDDADIRVDMAHYFNCGNQSEAIDYWGYNIYSWCGDSTFERSGYKSQVDFFKNYSIPVFFAEYGCNTQANGAESRDWQDAVALYSDDMTGVFSGGIVYMYFQETNDYGLVKVDSSGKATTMKNYDALSKVIAGVSPARVERDSYSPTNSPQPCPPAHDLWQINGDALPPTPDASVCKCMVDAASCAPAAGLDPEQYGDIFGYICGEQGGKYCAGINGNTFAGVYGTYSMCDDKSKLTHVLDEYYKGQNLAASSCSFEGKAKVVSAGAPPSSCSAILASASSNNEAARNAATNTAGAGGSGSGSGSNDDSAAISGKEIFVGLYALVAMAAGAGVMLW